MNIKKKKNLILILLIFCCCFVAIGYFIMIRSIIVQGKVRIDPAVWDVRFEEVTTTKTIGKATNYMNPTLDSYVVNFYANFKEVNDSITYKIKIGNRGNLDAELASMNFLLDGKDYIECDLKGLTVGTKLKKGKSIDIEVTIKYTGDNVEQLKEMNDIKLILNWKQAV